MWGILATLKGYWHAITSAGDWLLWGAAICVVGWAFARMYISIILAAAVGAGIMFFAVSYHWTGNQDKEIAQLRAELADARVAKDIADAATDEAQKNLLTELEITKENDAKIATLKNKLDEVINRPDCKINGDFLDELDKLR